MTNFEYFTDLGTSAFELSQKAACRGLTVLGKPRPVPGSELAGPFFSDRGPEFSGHGEPRWGGFTLAGCQAKARGVYFINLAKALPSCLFTREG